MKPKTMILMGLAITCGLGASYMTSRLLAERQTADEPEKVEILVASRNLSVHQKIVTPEEMFEKKLVAKENEPTDAIKDFDALKGKSLRVGRNKGDTVTAGNLYDKGALEIPDGHQAVAIRVNIETTASGLFSLPGSLVDLLLTIGSSEVRGTKTIILMENVLVLAADIRVTPDGEISAPAQVVTFALKREDVLDITTAKKMGEITLVLRSKDDKSIAKRREVTGGKLIDRRLGEEVKVVVEAPKVEPKVVEPKVEPKVAGPKIVTGHYDLVSGTEQGERVVTRVYWEQVNDGELTITRTQILDNAAGAAPGAPKRSGGPRDI
jgi:Flp pilus assembly protein CpaB